jgi:putative endonuclease
LTYVGDERIIYPCTVNIFRSSSPPAGGGRAIRICVFAGKLYINNMFYVYAIYNKEVNKTYIGQTIDLSVRLDEHNNHTYSGYTSRFQGSWELIYKESVATRSEALVREKQLKSYRGREFVRNNIPE